jgi:hypothetical protein
MKGDARLVVGRTPAEEATVSLGRFERGGGPELLAHRGLHIVVGVQEKSGLSRPGAMVAGDHVWIHAWEGQDLHLGKADVAKPLRGGFRRTDDLFLRIAREAAGGNGDKFRQAADGLGELGSAEGEEFFLAHGR